ncbi:MAG TPA: 16S rRNA (guanine(966)-N(2))-methyltransferase RsmD [Terracidiphilus sp.]|nr:16S rRNA (guanine(966)-N(2))-methyltransferase RsmD [Terracidiphilus sp.]
MRIIAGTLRSRTLQAPPGLATRPTSDRLRETLFNVLAPRIAGAHFLDLYAGSGAVGIEALSRGARSVVFVERAAVPLKTVRANLARLGLRDGFEVFAGTVAAFLKRGGADSGFDLVFIDPPYDGESEYGAALGLLGSSAAGLLNGDALVIAEHRRNSQPDESYGVLTRDRLLKQGDAALSFYRRTSEVAKPGDIE